MRHRFQIPTFSQSTKQLFQIYPLGKAFSKTPSQCGRKVKSERKRVCTVNVSGVQNNPEDFFSKYLLFCSAEETNSLRFGTTSGNWWQFCGELCLRHISTVAMMSHSSNTFPKTYKMHGNSLSTCLQTKFWFITCHRYILYRAFH